MSYQKRLQDVDPEALYRYSALRNSSNRVDDGSAYGYQQPTMQQPMMHQMYTQPMMQQSYVSTPILQYRMIT